MRIIQFQTLHLTTLYEMYPKFICSCRFMSYPLEINTCSAVGVYISPQIRILHTKRFFFAHQLKGKSKKKITVNFKGTAIFAITIIYKPCVFYTAGSHVCLRIDRRSLAHYIISFLKISHSTAQNSIEMTYMCIIAQEYHNIPCHFIKCYLCDLFCYSYSEIKKNKY